MGREAKLAEAHTLKLWRLEQEAKAMLDEAWLKMNTPSSSRIGAFFDALGEAAKQIIGHKGQEAVRESARYMESLLGFKPNTPTLADLGTTVEDFTDLIDEHARHALVLLRVWIRRMQRQGMDPQAITVLVKQDYAHGGQYFGLFKNAMKRTVAGAVNQIGKEVEWAAYRAPKRSDSGGK